MKHTKRYTLSLTTSQMEVVAAGLFDGATYALEAARAHSRTWDTAAARVAQYEQREELASYVVAQLRLQ